MNMEAGKGRKWISSILSGFISHILVATAGGGQNDNSLAEGFDWAIQTDYYRLTYMHNSYLGKNYTKEQMIEASVVKQIGKRANGGMTLPATPRQQGVDPKLRKWLLSNGDSQLHPKKDLHKVKVG